MKAKDYKEYKEILKNTIVPTGLEGTDKRIKYTPLAKWIIANTPKRLFKFRACNENNINAFRNKQIWFATGSQMNDDFDALLYCDKEKILKELNSCFDESGNLLFLDFLKTQGDVPENIKGIFSKDLIDLAISNLLKLTDEQIKALSFQLRCFIENGFKSQFPFIAQLEQHLIKFSCFSEDIHSPYMWGNYADNGMGFALAYDFRNGQYNECGTCERLWKTCFCPKNCMLYPIVYEDKMLNATEFARYSMQESMTRQALQNLSIQQPLFGQIMNSVNCSDIFMQTKIILQKSKDWQPEKEWRLTIDYNSPSYITDKNACVRKSPCALYLGRKIKETDELILRNIAHQQKIPVYKMVINDESDKYSLKPKRVRNSISDFILK